MQGARPLLALGLLFCFGLNVGPVQADQIESIQKFLETKVIEQYALTPSDSYAVIILNRAEIDSRLSKIKKQNLTFELSNDYSLLGKKIINLKLNTEPVTVLPVLAQLRASANAVVFNKALGRHVLITQNDLEEITQDLTFIPKGFVRNKNDVLGKETAVYIRLNQPVFPYMIREVPLIRSKQKLKLRWADPLVTVQVEGMALEDGYLNQEINVMNLASSKKLKGKIISSGVVEIR